MGSRRVGHEGRRRHDDGRFYARSPGGRRPARRRNPGPGHRRGSRRTHWRCVAGGRPPGAVRGRALRRGRVRRVQQDPPGPQVLHGAGGRKAGLPRAGHRPRAGRPRLPGAPRHCAHSHGPVPRQAGPHAVAVPHPPGDPDDGGGHERQPAAARQRVFEVAAQPVVHGPDAAADGRGGQGDGTPLPPHGQRHHHQRRRKGQRHP